MLQPRVTTALVVEDNWLRGNVKPGPDLFAQVDPEIQAKIPGQLKTVYDPEIALPSPIVLHVRGALRIGKVAVVQSARFRIDAPVGPRGA